MYNLDLFQQKKDYNTVINDIKLYIDPTGISVHKENLEYSFKTLRSKGSTKVASGNGAFHVQMNITFSPEMLLQLHRLIVQIRNIPFIYIKNNFIQESLSINLNNTGGSYFTVFGCSVSNHPSSPYSFICQLDLRYFNTNPYSNNLKYRKDFYYTGQTYNRINKYTHSVLSFNRVSLLTNAKKQSKNNVSLNNNKSIIDKILNNENPYKQYTYTDTEDQPYRSKAYVRYSNYIQIKALKESFSISFSNEDAKLLESFEKPLYEFYSIQNSVGVRNLLEQLMSHCISTTFIFKTYKREKFDPDELKFLRKKINEGIKSTDNYKSSYDKKKRNFEKYFGKKAGNNSKSLNKKNKLDVEEINNNYYYYAKDLRTPGKIKYQNTRMDNIASFEYVSDDNLFKLSGNCLRTRFFKPNIHYKVEANHVGVVLILTKEQHQTIDYTENNIKIEEENKLIESIKNKIQANRLFSDSDSSLRYKETYQPYFARSGFENVFVSLKYITLTTDYVKQNLIFNEFRERDTGEFTNDTVLTSVNGSFNHIISSIPIIGQSYPTHQFLGSIEPSYQFSFVGKNAEANRTGLPTVILDFETELNNCLIQSKKFPGIPDSSNILIDSFITKLFGSFKEEKIADILKGNETIHKIIKPNMSIHSSETFTIEGSPGSVGYNVRFSESKHYIEEELNSSVSNKLADDSHLTKFSNLLKTSNFSKMKGYSLKNYEAKYIDYKNWTTKNYSSDTWYSKSKSYAKNVRVTKEQDKYAFELCKILDTINQFLPKGKAIQLRSTLDIPREVEDPNARTSMSSHFINAAADITVPGMSSVFLIGIIYALKKYNKIQGGFGLGPYGRYSIDFFNSIDYNNVDDVIARLNNSQYDMSMSRAKQNFVHIDLNYKVVSEDKSPTGRKAEGDRQNYIRYWVGKNGNAAFRQSSDQGYDAAKIWFWSNRLNSRSEINKISDFIVNNQSKLGLNFSNNNEPFIGVLDDNNTEEIETTEITNVDDNYIERQIKSYKDLIVPENILKDKEAFTKFLANNGFNESELSTKDISFDYSQTSDSKENYVTVTIKENTMALGNQNNDLPQEYETPFVKNLKTYFKDTDLIKVESSEFSVGYGTGYEFTPYTTALKLKVKKKQYSKELQINTDLLNNFQLLASSILTEPYLYTDDVKEELERIKKELYGLDVVPTFYNFINQQAFEADFYTSFKNKKKEIIYSNNERLAINVAVSSLSGVTGAMIASMLTLSPLGWFISIAGTTYYLIDALTERRLNRDQLLQVGRIVSSFNSYKESLNQRTIEDYKDEIIKFKGNIGPTNYDFREKTLAKEKERFYDEIDNYEDITLAVDYFCKDLIYKNNIFNKFKELALSLKQSSKIRKILVKETSNDDYDDYRFVGVSDKAIVQEIKEYLFYLLYFPGADEVGNEPDTPTEVYEYVDKNTIKWKDNIIKNKLEDKVKKDTLFYQQINGNKSPLNGFFNKKKNSLREKQDLKLGLLKTILKALLEDSIFLNRDILEIENSDLLNIFDGKSVFELLETNAYPDIDTPFDPALSTNNSGIHPLFYFVDENEVVKNNPFLQEQKIRLLESSKILKNSKQFMSSMKEGAVFKGSSLEFEKLKKLTFKQRENVLKTYNNDDFLTDSFEYNFDDKDIDKVKNNNFLKKQTIKDNLKLINPQVNQGPSSKDKKEQIIDSYVDYMEQFKDIRNMFGSKKGFVEKNSNINIKYNLNKPLEIENFNVEEICNDSHEGIITLPTIKKALPTFRLYLVEEDDIYSDVLTAYDDFYYYNSVISFSVHNDREQAASVAKIQLQNLSGILDGTRKNTLKDIDVPSNIDEDLYDIKTAYKNEIDNVLLRPGINVQLRAGYESNTNDLDILISGRITDLSYSNNNTVCNIVVQSFGIELESIRKGLNAHSSEENVFYTTHHLLSHCMMSDELKHFGRRKIGAQFQSSEALEPSLDLKPYDNKSIFNFTYTRGLTDWFSENAIWIGVAFSAFPFARYVTKATYTKYITKYVPQQLKNLLSPKNLKAGTADLARKTSQFLSKSYAGQVVNAIGTAGIFLGKGVVNIADKTVFRVYKWAYNSANKQLISNNEYNKLVTKGMARYWPKIFGIFKGANKDAYIKSKANSYALNEFVRLYGAEAAVKQGLINDTFKAQAGALFGRGLSSSFQIFAPLAAGATGFGFAALFGLLGDSVAYGKDKFLSLFETIRDDRLKVTEKILLSPQDDNIFSPDPSYYINEQNSSLINRLGNALFSKYGFFLNEDDTFKESKFLYEKRLDMSQGENQYQLLGQTTWKVLDDMSHRHPGYIYGVRPYGNSLEYRVFFGLPNQRHFCKRITIDEVYRLNIIEEALSKLKNSSAIESFDRNSLKKLFKDYIPFNGTDYEFSLIAIDEYLRKTKGRFKPFRQYHYITSNNNIIANNIVVSGHDLINTVTVHYKESSEQNRDMESNTIELSSLQYVSASNKKEVVLKDPNIIRLRNAFRWGLSSLIKRSKKLYGGSLLILGETKINPHDVIILKDEITNMHGPVEVDYVNHSFDFNTGFITEIGVAAHVTANESLTYPSFNKMLEYESLREIYNSYSYINAPYKKFSKDGGLGTTEESIKSNLKDLVKEIYEQKTNVSPNTLNDYNKSVETLIDTIVNNTLSTINENNELGIPNVITDITPDSSDAILATTGIDGDTIKDISNTVLSTLAVGSGLAGLEKYAYIAFQQKKYGLLPFNFSSKSAFFLTTGLLTLKSLTDFGFKNLNESFSSGMLGKNFFKKAIFSTVKGGSNVQIYPLIRDGIPLLAGGLEEVSKKDIWDNIHGNIYNGLSNSIEGTLRREAEYKELGRKGLYEFYKDDEDWSIASNILIRGSSIFNDETRKKIVGWYLSDN